MKPNILFLGVDSLRSDYVFGNNNEDNTPNITKLIENGIFFKNAIGCSDYTFPCIESIFTSQYPIGCSEPSKNSKIYSPESSLLSYFKKNGYHLYATLPESLCLMGMDEPFENPDVRFIRKELNLYTGLREKILGKLKSENFNAPWFYYIYLMDLHRPYHVPKEFLHLKLNQRYKKNVNEIDSFVGDILKIIDIKKTILVLTSDHGEYISPFTAFNAPDESNIIKKGIKKSLKSLIPKSYKTAVHKERVKLENKIKSISKKEHEKRIFKRRVASDRKLFDDIVKVPLLFAGYNIKHQPVIKQQVRSIDIFPTLLEIAEILPNEITLQGQSLKPLLTGKTLENQPVYIESAYMETMREIPNSVVGIRTDKYKYFRDAKDSTKNIHLYDLENDPYEDENISSTYPEIINEFESIIVSIQETKSEKKPKSKLTKEDEKELEEELRKMGYI